MVYTCFAIKELAAPFEQMQSNVVLSHPLFIYIKIFTINVTKLSYFQ